MFFVEHSQKFWSFFFGHCVPLFENVKSVLSPWWLMNWLLKTKKDLNFCISLLGRACQSSEPWRGRNKKSPLRVRQDQSFQGTTIYCKPLLHYKALYLSILQCPNFYWILFSDLCTEGQMCNRCNTLVPAKKLCALPYPPSLLSVPWLVCNVPCSLLTTPKYISVLLTCAWKCPHLYNVHGSAPHVRLRGVCQWDFLPVEKTAGRFPSSLSG